MKNDKKNDIFEVIKDARTNPIQQIETMASELHKTEIKIKSKKRSRDVSGKYS